MGWDDANTRSGQTVPQGLFAQAANNIVSGQAGAPPADSTVDGIVAYESAISFAQAIVPGVGRLDQLWRSQTARLVDIATVGIGIFLVFGRIGCHSVACCHGRPARFGVVYGPAHERLGFWARWIGRRLWPVRSVESGVSLVLG